MSQFLFLNIIIFKKSETLQDFGHFWSNVFTDNALNKIQQAV